MIISVRKHLLQNPSTHMRLTFHTYRIVSNSFQGSLKTIIAHPALNLAQVKFFVARFFLFRLTILSVNLVASSNTFECQHINLYRQ